MLLQFAQRSREARNELLTGAARRSCREVLQGHGLPLTMPTGALVFCAPSQYRAAQRLMVGRDLRRRHVLVAESLEYLIEAALLNIPCRRRPSRRRSRNIIGPLPAALVTATSRSFIGVLPRELDRQWCNRHPLRPIVLADPDASYQPINCTFF